MFDLNVIPLFVLVSALLIIVAPQLESFGISSKGISKALVFITLVVAVVLFAGAALAYVG